MFNTSLIKNYLDGHGINYSLWPDFFNGSVRYPFKGSVRTVLLKIDGQYAIMVTKDREYIDFTRMKSILNAASVEPASEEECESLFPNCDATALPVLGTLVNMPVFCSQNVLASEEICFNPWTHDKVVKVPVNDFINLEKPTSGNFTKQGYRESEFDHVF